MGHPRDYVVQQEGDFFVAERLIAEIPVFDLFWKIFFGERDVDVDLIEVITELVRFMEFKVG